VIQKVALYRSRDLNDWQRIKELSLVDMAFSGQQLRQNEIALSDNDVSAYLKLQLLEPQAEFGIQGVTAVLQSSERIEQRSSLSVQASAASGPGVLDFDLGGPFRVTRVRLEP